MLVPGLPSLFDLFALFFLQPGIRHAGEVSAPSPTIVSQPPQDSELSNVVLGVSAAVATARGIPHPLIPWAVFFMSIIFSLLL